MVGTSFLLSLLFVASVAAVALLLGSFFRNGGVAMISTVLIIWIAMPVVQAVLESANVEPWFLLSYAGSILTAVVAPAYPPHLVGGGGGSSQIAIYTPYLWEGIVIMAGYLVLSLVIGTWIYNRREVK
jgi:ABC-type transport system involved in multi-copper enzyme maturation permease subunit